MRYILEPEKRVPVTHGADVVVVGGGTGGAPAAIAAARNGVDVLVVERANCLGGVTTGGLMTRMDVSHAYWGRVPHEKRVARGLYLELVERCRARGGLIEEYAVKRYLAGMLSGVEVFDPQVLKFVLQQMAEKAGVRLLYHTLAVGTRVVDGEVQGVIVENKSGRQAVTGRVFVDATGDGDVAVQAGAPYEKGRPDDGRLQPVTMTFRIGGVDVEALFRAYGREQTIRRDRVPPETRPYRDEVARAKRNGVYHFPKGDFWFHLTPIRDQVYVNTTRIHGVDATRAEDVTRAEVEGLRQVMQLMTFVRTYMTGFEDAYLVDVGAYIGVRETRRVTGEYVLTHDDVVTGRKFPDAIAASSVRIDIHNVTTSGIDYAAPPDGDYYQIPFRCVLPQRLRNVLTVGRCISATHEAHGSTRQVPTTIPVAQAAGTAAAMAVTEGTSLRALDVARLQRTLVNQGAFLGDEGPP